MNNGRTGNFGIKETLSKAVCPYPFPPIGGRARTVKAFYYEKIGCRDVPKI